jgi:two-component system, LuxR family, sensor kinase FixL
MNPENIDPHVELEERLQFETLIADLSSRFVNLPAGKVDGEIEGALRRICEFVGIDLAVLWQRSDGASGSFTPTHRYSAQEDLQPPESISQEQYPWAVQQVLAGRMIGFSSPEELPAEAAVDLEHVRRRGIRSNLTIPLSVGGQPSIGALALNSLRAQRDWPDALVKRLQLAVQIFINALARKRADQALRESEERLSLAADSAEAGLWVLDCRTGVFWATEKARAIFGYPPDEVISMERLKASVHPDDWHPVQGSLERSVQAGEPVHVEYRIRLGDGRTRWVLSRGRPHFTPGGAADRVMGLSIDITERKRAEAAFRASEARLAAGTDLVGLGYYEINYGEGSCFMDDRFRHICGIPPDLQQGLGPVEFWMAHVHPDDLQLLLAERQKLHDGKTDRISAEYRYLHPAHGQKWIRHLARIVGCGATEGGIRTFGVIRNITQQKQVERETQELRDNLAHLTRVSTLGALSGSLAHELNQPLGIILSNAQAAQELLGQEPPDLAEVQAILADIVAADRRAGEVIERLRAMLKRGQASLQPIQLNRVIEEVLHLLRADLIGRGVTVVRELAPGLPLIAGDRVQLQQLVLNLILNGSEAMAANAPGVRRLHLQTTLHQGRVRASVRDEGIGLLTDVERFFQPFYTTKAQGLGMGLAICRSIVAAHAGRIWAEPHPERGVVLHFELPVAIDEGRGTRGEGRGAEER